MHPTSTHVSISGQHTPMSPLLASTHPASTHVSISGQHTPMPLSTTSQHHACLHAWPASTHKGHCCAFPGRGFSTSSAPKSVPLQKGHAGRGPAVLLYRKPGARTTKKKKKKKKKKQNLSRSRPRCPRTGISYAVQEPPHSDMPELYARLDAKCMAGYMPDLCQTLCQSYPNFYV